MDAAARSGLRLARTCPLPFTAGRTLPATPAANSPHSPSAEISKSTTLTRPCPRRYEVFSRAVHWDALTTTVQYSSSHFAARNGSLIHGHATAHFDVSAELTGAAFRENDSFTLHFDLRNANLSEFAQLAGVTQPFAALWIVRRLSRARKPIPTATDTFGSTMGMAYGVGIPSVTSDLRLAEGELHFNNIEASVYGAPISGSAGVSTSYLTLLSRGPHNVNAQNVITQSGKLSKNEFRLNLSGHNLDLARFPRCKAIVSRPMASPISRCEPAAPSTSLGRSACSPERPCARPGAGRRFLCRCRQPWTPTRSQRPLRFR